MAVCKDCKQEMLDPKTESCTHNALMVGDKEEFYERDTTYYDYNARCHDCGILNKPGNYHHYGCDMERCPKCGGQLIFACGCFDIDEKTVKQITPIHVLMPVRPRE